MHVFLYLFWAIIMCFIPVLAHANTIESPLAFKNPETDQYIAAPGIATDIRTSINGTIARTHVIQYFYNDTDSWKEGRYTYPLPENTAVDKLVMVVGEKKILGFIAEKREAREVYENAKRQGRASSLLEQHRPNIFRTAVANIPPKSLIAIEIAYQHEISYKNAQFVLRLPLAITPRFDNFNITSVLTYKTPEDEQEYTYSLKERLRLLDFEDGRNSYNIQVHLSPQMGITPPLSDTHSIKALKLDKNSYNIVINYLKNADSEDFILKWGVEEASVAPVFVNTERREGEVFTHLHIIPNSNDLPQQQDDKSVRLLGDSNKYNVPRHVIMVIDTSGSMSGPSIRQAKAAIKEAIYDLNPTDRFNIIRFESYTESLFYESALATTENINRAISWVNMLHAAGGTQMRPALQQALADKASESHLKQILFITDGAIGFENKIAEDLQHAIGDARFYAIGIGAAPNTHLMDLLARIGRGTYTYIRDVRDTHQQMSGLLKQMKNPVITHLQIEFTGQQDAEIIPTKLPDLLDGEPLSVVIRSKAPVENLRLKGLYQGKLWEQNVAIQAQETSGVGKLYARKKVSDLKAQHFYRHNPHLAQNIRDLALAHQIMSEETSFVAVDEERIRPKNATLFTEIHNPNLPKGWQLAEYDPREAAVLYRQNRQLDEVKPQPQPQAEEINLPQTADGYRLRLTLGVILVILGLLGLVMIRNKGRALCAAKIR